MTELDLTQVLPAIMVPPTARHRQGTVPVRCKLSKISLEGQAWSDRATLADLLTCLAALPVETRDELIKHALGIGGLGGFETDPRDSAALLELRQGIDDELGWENEEQEEEANYPARLRDMTAERDAERLISQEWEEKRDALKKRLDEAEGLLKEGLDSYKWSSYAFDGWSASVATFLKPDEKA